MGDPVRAAAISDFTKQINDMVTHFGLMDIILVILVLIGLLVGYRKGLSVFLSRLVQTVMIITITLEFVTPVVSMFPKQSPIIDAIIQAFTFLSIVIVSFYVMKAILEGIAKIFKIQFADFLDKVGGAITGVLVYALTFSFVCYFVLMFSTDALRDTFEKGNMSGVFLEKASPAVHEAVRHLIPGAVRASAEPVKRSAPVAQGNGAHGPK